MQQDQNENQSLLGKLALWIGTERRLYCLVFLGLPTLLFFIGSLYLESSLIPEFPDLVYGDSGTIWDGLRVFYFYLFYIPFLIYNSLLRKVAKHLYRSIILYLSAYLFVVGLTLFFLTFILFDLLLLLKIGFCCLTLACLFISIYKLLLFKLNKGEHQELVHNKSSFYFF
jgi:hypothetical protein